MNAQELVERFSKAPNSHKAAGLVLVTAFFGAAFYFMFYSDLVDQVTNLDNQVNALEMEKAEYEEKQRRYNAFRAQVHKLLEEQKELVKVLPTNAEIPSFLQSIHAQGELAGLNILTFDQKAESQQNFYATIPVEMSISGTYHQITKFFYSVGKLKRIVNIKDLSLKTPKSTEAGILLNADFVTTTYRFIEPKSQAPAKPGGSRG